jgi:hypothetical protein
METMLYIQRIAALEPLSRLGGAVNLGISLNHTSLFTRFSLLPLPFWVNCFPDVLPSLSNPGFFSL